MWWRLRLFSKRLDRAAAALLCLIERLWFFPRLRRAAARIVLRRIGLKKKNAVLTTWQPIIWVFIKTAVITAGIYFLLQFRSRLGRFFFDAVAFFRLEEIYNFDLPEPAFYDRLALIILAAAAGLYGGYLLLRQLQALFSTLIIDTTGERVHYLESYLVFRRLHTIPFNSVNSITLQQELISRIFGIGGILISTTSGERIMIRSIWRAAEVVKFIKKQKAVKRKEEEPPKGILIKVPSKDSSSGRARNTASRG